MTWVITLSSTGEGEYILGYGYNLDKCKAHCQKHAENHHKEFAKENEEEYIKPELEWSEDWYAYHVSHKHAGWDDRAETNYFIDEVARIETEA